MLSRWWQSPAQVVVNFYLSLQELYAAAALLYTQFTSCSRGNLNFSTFVSTINVDILYQNIKFFSFSEQFHKNHYWKARILLLTSTYIYMFLLRSYNNISHAMSREMVWGNYGIERLALHFVIIIHE